MKWKEIICVAVYALCFAACTPLVFEERDSVAVRSCVRLILDGVGADLRSSMDVSENVVKDISLFVYRDSMLVTDMFFVSFENMSVNLQEGEKYDFYILANVGRCCPPVHQRDLCSFKCIDDAADGVMPMCWSRCGVLAGSDKELTVSLVRLFSKVVLSVDCQVPGMRVLSVALMQAPFSVCPFAVPGSKAGADDVGNGDYASEEDIAVLNSGGDISFYLLENMQGVLLEGNTDPKKKVPDNLSSLASACTYLEVRCDFVKDADKEGGVSYRMCLGKDNVADFNIERNSIIHLTLTLTTSGLKIEDSWKVVPDYVQHAADLVLDKDELELVVGCSSSLHAGVFPVDACSHEIEWVSDDDEVAVVDQDGNITAVGKGKCVVRAISIDRNDVWDECAVTVVPVAPERVELNFSEHAVALGDRFTARFRVVYNDGSASAFTSYGFAPVSHCSTEGWTVSDDAVIQINTYGVLAPVGIGTSTVTMTVGWWEDDVYNSCSASGVITVTDAYVTDVYVSAPPMFYNRSGGPGLYGIFSDGSERMLVADEWIISVDGVTYDEENGLVIESEENMVTGVTKCMFTASYGGFTAGVEMLYGKWIRDVRGVKTLLSGAKEYLYRLYVVYDDFTEEPVPFICHVSSDGRSWTSYGEVTDAGIILDWSVNHVKLETSEKYHDYTGALRIWSTEAR